MMNWHFRKIAIAVAVTFTPEAFDSHEITH
jgi:hypothetical protein